MSSQSAILPKSFVLSRLHSLTGLWIVLFLIEHLLTNSQAALFFGEDGSGFIRMVNFIKGLPYVQVIEVVLIGVPFVYHAILGIRYAIKGKMNSFGSDGAKPSLKYSRNYAYTIQRISAWILLVGVILHVSFFRFAVYPLEAKENNQNYYFVHLNMDKGLYTVSDRLGVKLYDQVKVNEQIDQLFQLETKIQLVEKRLNELSIGESQNAFSQEKMSIYESLQRLNQKKQWITTLAKKTLQKGEVIAVSKDFGTITLLNVREAFKSPFKIALYTVFVLAACFHGFNGLWTFCMTWGVMITAVAQRKVLRVCVGLMVLLALLGLSSVWGTYLINLKS